MPVSEAKVYRHKEQKAKSGKSLSRSTVSQRVGISPDTGMLRRLIYSFQLLVSNRREIFSKVFQIENNKENKVTYLTWVNFILEGPCHVTKRTTAEL